MKANSEYSVCVVKCLFDSVAVMHIDIQVQNPRVCFEQLENAEDDVIDVAETTRLRFLAVVVPSRPVYGDIALSSNNQVCRIDAAPRCQLAEIIQSLKSRAIDSLIDFEDGVEFGVFPHFEPLLLAHRKLLDDIFGFGRHPRFEIFYVERVVEGGEFLRGGLL